MKNKLNILGIMLLAVIAAACGRSTVVEKLQDDLEAYPEYSIILEDMKEEGTFFNDYYHKYKTIYGEKADGDSLAYRTEITDWQKVRDKEYDKLAPYLGMVVASKSPDGEVSDTPQPPGYQYVGDSRYGQWRTDSHGNSFWEFYGKFALMSHLFGMMGGPVYRNDYNDYRRYRNSGRPYYGKNNSYGTNGTLTKKTNPTFFQRKQATEAARKQSFSNRVKQRTRRSNMSGVRSRSRGFGK